MGLRSRIALILISTILFINEHYAASINFNTRDAVVWHPKQTISGVISGFVLNEILVNHNQNSFQVALDNSQQFSFELMLEKDINKIWIELLHYGEQIVSDTLFYTLGYVPTPILKPLVSIEGNNISLSSELIENPYDIPVSYTWSADDQNPANTEVLNEGSMASVEIPNVPGKYFFNLLAIAGEDSVWFQTMVIREADNVHAFNLDNDHPTWMNDAVIYEITPYNFVANGKFNDITAKLPELAKLGINTIWLQPVFRSSYRGQGYDVVDYLSINPALGTEGELHQLITTAKELEMKVLFDLVLNHTSIQHPYAQDRIEHGENSHYSDYYQTVNDGKPYSQHYNRDEHGFMFYFWEDLVNLNYHNEEVQRWMLEVCKHWIKKYDIDGYRFDAIWGVNARNPSFAGRLRTELKSIKPEVLMLAEDKGADPEVYELGFDAAFDWAAGRAWVSQWSWEYEYSQNESKTIFNHPNAQVRGGLLRAALFPNKEIAFRKLRFLENNDVHRFIEGHGLERTKMAASLLFGVPGIPMLYNGQEIGFRQHPYVTHAVFIKNTTIESLDQEGLFGHYQKLIQLKKQYPALSDTTFNEVSLVPQEAIVAFHRWHQNENFIVIVNMGIDDAMANINLSEIFPDQSSTEDFWLEDVLEDKIFGVNLENLQATIPMEGYSVRWLLLKDEGTVTGANEPSEKGSFVLYPNPSNGEISITFPDKSYNKIRIIDMLGRVVYEEDMQLKNIVKKIDLNLPSKMYLFQIENGKDTETKRIIINNKI